MAITYDPIVSTKLVSAANTITFTNFSGYTDLILVAHMRGVTDGAASAYLRFNNDDNTNYDATVFYGAGTNTVGAGVYPNIQQIYSNVWGGLPNGTPVTCVWHIFNYSNTNVRKTVLRRFAERAQETSVIAGVWRNMAAITTLTVLTPSDNFATNSMFTLYGIQAA